MRHLPVRTAGRPNRLAMVGAHVPFIVRAILVTGVAVTGLAAVVPAQGAGPFPDRVVDFQVGPLGGFNEDQLPEIVLGGPRGRGLENGSAHVFSLGQGGTITLEFVESVIVDGPDADFTVFENAFLTTVGTVTGPPFAEAARVLVSMDGTEFFEFPCALEDTENLHPGCAGVFPVLANVDDAAAPAPTVPTTAPITSMVGVPVPPQPPDGSGGDSFDLADLGLTEARFIRIVSGPGRFPAAEGKGGFDLDAIAAVHWRAATDGGGSDDVDPPDTDADGISDTADNCPAVPNPAQQDREADGIGDACDLCPATANAANVDADGDGSGDACDPCPHDEACGPLEVTIHAGGRPNKESEGFITFAAPAGKVITVARDDLAAELRVNFAPSVDPLTFRATVQRTDVTALFTPVVPGSTKRVAIPLPRRRTRVRLRIKGQKSNGARARDVDRLVFRKKRR